MRVRASASAGGLGGGSGACAAAGAETMHAASAKAARRRRSVPRSLRMAAAFLERMEPVGGEVLPALLETVRPADLDPVDARRRAEAEVHAEIVLGEIAAAAA